MPEEAKTKTTNIHARSQVEGLPLLPKTLSDAVAITRSLGIRYLWIDALCILQDSIDDWSKESVKMGSVYGHAYFTIAAASSSDTAMGFRGTNSQLSSLKDKILLDFAADVDDPFRRICFSPVPTYWFELAQEPLLKRGWTLQERHLSRRVIYYTATHLLWECRCSRSSSDLPWIVWSDPLHPRHLRRLFDKGPVVMDLWEKLIENYSMRNLTVPSDKLPAIAGLAAAMHLVTGRKYAAGLWQEGFPEALCWFAELVDDGDTDWQLKHYRPMLYRAPTWSWASVEGPICFDNRTDPERPDCARVLKTTIELASDNEMGPVKSGSLIISGRFRVAYTRQPLVSNPESRFYNAEVFDSPSPKQCIGALILDTSTRGDQKAWPEIHCLRIIGKRLAPCMSKEMPRQMQKFPWLVSKFDELPDWTVAAMEMLRPTAVALALVPTGRKEGEYTRVGLVRYMLEAAFEGCQEAVVTVV
jgi:hypothetical protein